MNTKTILLSITLTIVTIAAAYFSHYSQRMTQYNAHVCAVNGYQPDCKTPLEGEQTK